ncbi:MAG: glycerophosphodiester phosphodiesterase [Desulfobacterales bacterium]|nr:glycerophosphodiester phosphodiesterase [Desulfobacterales bacterium]MCP4161405.1 glycerophosphodiester phosphodiesterase [Deltaproteobacteria bacterium]
MQEVKDILNLKKPFVFGHRGYKAKFPENTLISFDEAVKAGCPAIELDVMLSTDRYMVVFHDETLERTTNGKGLVSEATLSQLKNLDAGSWFDSSFKNIRIPELSEVFGLLGSKTLINVEIKKECFEKNFPKDSIEHQVLELINSFNLKNRVIISSFSGEIIKRIKAIDPNIETAYIFDKVPDDLDELITTGIFSVHISKKIAKTNFVKLMHKKKIKVFVWTVNEVEDFNMLIKNGVDGIFTDNPGLFIE